jgi:hypothetical protein
VISDLLTLAVLVVPVLFYLSNQRKDWWFLDPINTFWVMYVLFGVVEFWPNRVGWSDIYGDSVVQLTLCMYVLAGVGVWIGYALHAGRALGEKLPVLKGQDRQSRFLLVGASLLAVGLLAYAYVIRVSGGLEEYLSSSRTYIRFDVLGGYMLNLLSCVSLGLMILLCTTYYNRRYPVLKWLVLFATAMFAVWNIYSGTRSGIISTAAVILGAVYGARRRNPPLLVAAGTLAVTVFLVGFVAGYRGQMYGGSFNSNDAAPAMWNRSMQFYTTNGEGGLQLGSEFGMSLAAVKYVPDAVPFDRGYMLLELFTMPVPRAWWPEKVYPEGQAWDRLHRVAGTAQWVNAAGLLSGPAPGLVGKYFYMGGALGVALGSLWTGIFLQSVRTYVRRYSGVTGVLLAVGCCLFGFSEMNNPLAWPYAWLPATGIGIFLTAMLCRKRSYSRGWPAVRQDFAVPPLIHAHPRFDS